MMKKIIIPIVMSMCLAQVASAAEEAAELLKLRQKHESSTAQAIQKLEQERQNSYLNVLKSMKKEAIQKDNLTEALAYENEIKKMEGLLGGAASDNSLADKKISPEALADLGLLNRVVFIENSETKRYLFSDGKPIEAKRGAEGGWKAGSGFESPKVVGADANYYNRAYWVIKQSGDAFLIENHETKRYLFSDGKPIEGKRGAEGGWKAVSGFESPNVVGADANYYNRALWNIYKIGDNFIIENKMTKRYLFSDGKPIEGKRGAEGGWKAVSGFESPNVVGADANYYNRAYWKISPPR